MKITKKNLKKHTKSFHIPKQPIPKLNSDCIQEELNSQLSEILSKNYPEMINKVLSQKNCDIDFSFLAFLEPYYYLSKLIPPDWHIIDFGCAYSPQAYYFRNHKRYTGVDYSDIERFKFDNTIEFVGSIKEYIIKNPTPPYKTFAICNNVPSEETRLIRKFYSDCYIYYTK